MVNLFGRVCECQIQSDNMKYSWTSIKRPQAPGQSINQSTLFNEFNTGQYFNWITSGPQTKIIKQKLSDKIHLVNEKELQIYVWITLKRVKNYITIMKYPYNEYLQTIITIRIQLGWVKRKEGCEMPD